MGEKKSQFEELLLTHLDGAYNVAFWLTESDADAQAIVEKACVQAWAEFLKSHEADLRTWLLKIVLRIAHRWIEERSKRSTVVPFVPPHDAAANPKPAGHISASTEGQAIHEGAGQDISQALNRLPVELREILVLHELEGCNYQQLASVLRISVEAVATRLSFARRCLRNELHGREVKGER